MRAPHRVRMNLEVTFEYEAENASQIEMAMRLKTKGFEHAIAEAIAHTPEYRTAVDVLVTRIESRRRKEFEYGKSRTTAKR